MPRLTSVKWIAGLFVTLSCTLVWAGPMQVCDLAGDSRDPFDLGNKKAVVFIFVGVDCPISNSYAPEINRIVADYQARGLNFYIVYSDPALSKEDATKHRKAFGFTCPALLDHAQLLMKKLGVSVTPEVAVVGENESTLYEGRIDDRYEDFGKQRFSATTHDLRDALDLIVAGKKVITPVTKAVGCPI